MLINEIQVGILSPPVTVEKKKKNFVEAEQDTAAAVRSLSLDIRNSSGTILLYLAGGILRSLKLHGKLSGLVHYVTCLFYIRELCLSSTNGLTEDDLTQLCKITTLEDLKLVGVSLGGLVIKSGDFRGLLRLCLVQCPSLPTITKGALPILLSLRLLNQGLHGLSGIDIECHEVLQEVALDSEVSQETRKEWEDAAKKHPKRPKVLFFERLDPEETGSMVKYVVARAPGLEKESSVVGHERDTDGVGPDSCDTCAASCELPTDRDDGMSSSSSIDPGFGDTNLQHVAEPILLAKQQLLEVVVPAEGLFGCAEMEWN